MSESIRWWIALDARTDDLRSSAILIAKSKKSLFRISSYFETAEKLTSPIEPFLDYNGTARQPSSVDTRAQNLNPMAMRMAMAQHSRMRNGICSIRVELIQQNLTRIQPHKHAPTEQKPTHSQGPDTLDFPVAVREAFGRGFQRPRDRAEREEIGHEIREGVIRVGHKGLGMKHVATDELANGHGQIGHQTDARDPHTGIEGVARGQINVVMMVVMVASVASVATMVSSLSGHEGKCSSRGCNNRKISRIGSRSGGCCSFCSFCCCYCRSGRR